MSVREIIIGVDWSLNSGIVYGGGRFKHACLCEYRTCILQEGLGCVRSVDDLHQVVEDQPNIGLHVCSYRHRGKHHNQPAGNYGIARHTWVQLLLEIFQIFWVFSQACLERQIYRVWTLGTFLLVPFQHNQAELKYFKWFQIEFEARSIINPHISAVKYSLSLRVFIVSLQSFLSNHHYQHDLLMESIWWCCYKNRVPVTISQNGRHL